MQIKFCFVLICVACNLTIGHAQNKYAKNSIVEDFNITSAINTDAKRLNNLKSSLTVLDFFGTWCIPCVKALPHLADLKNKFKNSLSIVLISTEEKEVLGKFIQKRQVSFPVIIDASNNITNLFQPPSYPYTILLNSENKIVYIGHADGITDSLIKGFMQSPQKNIPEEPKQTTQTESDKKDKPTSTAVESTKVNVMNSSNSIVAISQQLLYKAKTDISDENWVQTLANLEFNKLTDSLENDDDKKAFWINVYNAFTYIQLSKNADLYLSRNSFFKKKNINIAGNYFSLDLIEHGILRRSKIKWSLGYVNKFFPSAIEKKFRVTKVDHRIHFALNCGAKSCPPIAFYNNATINNQLNIATKSYLQSEVKYDTANNAVKIPKLFSWFKGDFGGKKGIYNILYKNELIPVNTKPALKYLPYDWTLYLNNYKK